MAHVHEIVHKFKWFMRLWRCEHVFPQNENVHKTRPRCEVEPENKRELSAGNFLTCPNESCPASSSMLGQVTVNGSDDSSHLPETNETQTSEPAQIWIWIFFSFSWPTFLNFHYKCSTFWSTARILPCMHAVHITSCHQPTFHFTVLYIVLTL